MWTVPDLFQKDFLNACWQAAHSSDHFKVFRRHPVIKTVIENSNSEHAVKTFDALENSGFPFFKSMNRFAESDKIGSPETFEIFEGIQISPTTIRYLYITHLIRKLHLFPPLGHIIEIGGGYGGQCKIIHDLYLLESYSLYDLPEVLALQKQFLATFQIIPDLINASESLTERKADLVIAWCSWSELDLGARIQYLENIIAPSKHFFICSNYDAVENLALIKSLRSDVKTYSDEIVNNVFYA